LSVERLMAGIAAARRFRNPTPLIFPLLHFGRDLAWVVAIGMWLARQLGSRPSKPAHSMRPRTSAVPRDEPLVSSLRAFPARTARPKRILGLIPAHNEAANLAAVVAELRASRPDLDIL